MKSRNAFAVFFLPFITLGIYQVVWFYKSTCEMRSCGAQIPHFILIFIPIASLVWLFKFSKGVEHATHGKISAGAAFALQLFLGSIGNAVVQSKLNTII